MNENYTNTTKNKHPNLNGDWSRNIAECISLVRINVIFSTRTFSFIFFPFLSKGWFSIISLFKSFYIFKQLFVFHITIPWLHIFLFVSLSISFYSSSLFFLILFKVWLCTRSFYISMKEMSVDWYPITVAEILWSLVSARKIHNEFKKKKSCKKITAIINSRAE